MIYGYCSSNQKKNLEKQKEQIISVFPTATVFQEHITVEHSEPIEKFKNKITEGDTLVFASITCMSQADEIAFQLYDEFYRMGVKLVFLQEPYFNSDVCDRIRKLYPYNDTVAILMELIHDQILIRYEQKRTDVLVRQKSIKSSIENARSQGKQIGQKKGAKLETKKGIAVREGIKKYSRDFGGSMNDIECIRHLRVSPNTFYKYKKELKMEMQQDLLKSQ